MKLILTFTLAFIILYHIRKSDFVHGKKATKGYKTDKMLTYTLKEKQIFVIFDNNI